MFAHLVGGAVLDRFSRLRFGFFSCLTNAVHGALRSTPAALSKRSHAGLPGTGGAGNGFILGLSGLNLRASEIAEALRP